MYSETRFRKSALRSAVLLALSINGAALTIAVDDAQATQSTCGSFADTDSANFTMLAAVGNGGVVGGTNNVVAHWDGNANNASSDYTGPGGVSNVTMTSTAPFFGHSWTAHDIQMFSPGSYSFDVTLQSAAHPNGANGETGTLNVTVPAGQLGMHMLFDWNGNNNIDVFVVAKPTSIFGAGLLYSTQTNTKGQHKCDTSFTGTIVQNCLFDGGPYGSAGAPTNSKVWMLASVDGNGDGLMGIPMAANGPFAGFNANFNLPGTLTLTSGTPCNPTVDTVPDTFSFPPKTGIAPNTANVVSDPIQVSGLGVSQTPQDPTQTAPISITGTASAFAYSLDNGVSWTTAAGTVGNGDKVLVRQTAAATDNVSTDAVLTIGGISGTFTVFTFDTIPAAFSFGPAVTGVTPNTPQVSPPITVSGIDAPSAISISSSNASVFAYSINGGAYTSNPGTVNVGDTVTVQVTSAATDATSADVTLTIGGVSATFSVITAGGASKSSTGNNFTMLDGTGGITGGTNDVAMFWDGQLNTSTSDPVTPTTAHMRLSSSTPFFGYTWTAHHIRVFGPGTYTIDTTCTTAQLEAGTAVCNNPLEAGQTQQFYTFTVGANQMAAHMLFDWNTSKNIDVVDIWNLNAVFGPSQLYTGAVGFNAASTSWSLMSTDWDGDGQNGAAMIDGPFKGFKANFNINYAGTTAATNYTPTVNVADPSNAPGCSISSTPVSAVKRADWWLVAGFLAWLGAIRIRFTRKTQS